MPAGPSGVFSQPGGQGQYAAKGGHSSHSSLRGRQQLRIEVTALSVCMLGAINGVELEGLYS
eukprot:scaffold76263_cov38-Prasinocladus_malaysianus.AAC.1